MRGLFRRASGKTERDVVGFGALRLSLSSNPDAAMPGPWLLLALALTLNLTGVPGGRAQPEAAQQEAVTAAERPGLDDLLRQVERVLFLRENIQRLQGDQGEHSGEWMGLSGTVGLGYRESGGNLEAERRGGLVISLLPFGSSETLPGYAWAGSGVDHSLESDSSPSPCWKYFTGRRPSVGKRLCARERVALCVTV